jgi:hypothetical protein
MRRTAVQLRVARLDEPGGGAPPAPRRVGHDEVGSRAIGRRHRVRARPARPLTTSGPATAARARVGCARRQLGGASRSTSTDQANAQPVEDERLLVGALNSRPI